MQIFAFPGSSLGWLLAPGPCEGDEAPGPGVGGDVAQMAEARQDVAHDQAIVLAVDAVAAQHIVGKFELRSAVLQVRVVELVGVDDALFVVPIEQRPRALAGFAQLDVSPATGLSCMTASASTAPTISARLPFHCSDRLKYMRPPHSGVNRHARLNAPFEGLLKRLVGGQRVHVPLRKAAADEQCVDLGQRGIG